VSEREEACEAFVEAASGRVGIVLGIGANAIADAVALARHGERSGVDALFLPAPSYYAARLDGLADYFCRVAEATRLPIVLYDNPYVTGIRLSASFMAKLVEQAPSFEYVKVTDRSHGKVEAILAETSLVPLSGSDDVMHHQILRGARGVLTAVPCVVPLASRKWWNLLEAGESEEAFDVFATRIAAVALEMMSEGDEYPALTKECLVLTGVLSSAEVKPPLVSVAATRRDDLRRMLRVAGEAVVSYA
jgi:4-hydroxy-tetrahydrodipicolinate synthase